MYYKKHNVTIRSLESILGFLEVLRHAYRRESDLSRPPDIDHVRAVFDFYRNTIPHTGIRPTLKPGLLFDKDSQPAISHLSCTKGEHGVPVAATLKQAGFWWCLWSKVAMCSVVMEVQRYLWPLMFAILGTHVENMFRLNKYGPCAIDS